MTEFFAAVWLAIMAAIIAWGATNTTWRRELVERGYASYCPDTGSWAYKGECK